MWIGTKAVNEILIFIQVSVRQPSARHRTLILKPMPSIPYQRRDERPRMYLTFYIDFSGLITSKMQEIRRYLDNQCPLP